MQEYVQMKLFIEKDINILLRKYVLDLEFKNKEKAINFILKTFLNGLYKDGKKI